MLKVIGGLRTPFIFGNLRTGPRPPSIQIDGLTTNPTYGETAQHGVALTGSVANPAPDVTYTYRWYVTSSAGAALVTTQGYTPSAASHNEHNLVFEATGSDGSVLSSSAYVIRYAPPVFSTQPSISGTATIGQTLTFDAGIASPAATLTITTLALDGVDKRVELVGDTWDTTGESAGTITYQVSAVNSGGTTLSDIVSVPLTVQAEVSVTQFGANTPVGAGAISTAEADGVYGELTVSGGMISPNTSPMTAGTQTVGAETWTIVAGEASCLMSEIDTVAAAIPLSTTFLRVRGSGTIAGGQQTTPARAFTGLTIIPYGFVDDADPASMVTPILMEGHRFATGSTNVRIMGFEIYNPANNHVAGTDGATTNCGYEKNEIRGRDFRTMQADGTMQSSFPTQMNGVKMSSSQSCYVRGNYIHDVFRAVTEGSAVDFVVEDNLLVDVYQNFTNTVDSTRPIIRRNKGQHVWAASHDIGSPHAGAGGSAGQPTVDGVWEENWWDSGNARLELHRAMFDAGTLPANESQTRNITMAATGAKRNQDGAKAEPYNYTRCISRNEIVRTLGIGTEIANGLDCVIENLTLVENTDLAGTGSGSSPDLNMSGCVNLQMSKCLVPTYTVGASDDNATYPRTLDTIFGHDNHNYTGYPIEDVFVGDAGGGFSNPDINSFDTIFAPKAGTFAALNNIGFTYPAVDPYAAPAATGGVATRLDQVRFDGTFRADAAITGVASIPNDVTTMMFKFGIYPETDGTTGTIYDVWRNELHVKRSATGQLDIYFKDSADATEVLDCTSSFVIPSGQWSYCWISYDHTSGRLQVVINGEHDPFVRVTKRARNSRISGKFETYGAYVGGGEGGGGFFTGGLEGLAIAYDRAVPDLSDPAVLSTIFAPDGTFCDHGVNGVNTGVDWQIYLAGPAATWGDTTGNTTWTNAGLTVFSADTTAPVLTSPTGTSSGTTSASGSVTTDEANGTLYYRARTGATVSSGAEMLAASSQAVSATGAQAVAVADLTASTSYTIDYMQVDAAGNTSTIASSAAFTTDAAASFAPTTISILNPVGTATAAIPTPTNVAGDIIVKYQFGAQGDMAHTTNVPVGYEMIGERTGPTQNRKVLIAAKISTGGETGDHTLVSSGAEQYGGGAFVIRLDSAPTSISAAVVASIGVSTGAATPAGVATGATTGVVIPLAIYHAVNKTTALAVRDFTGMTSTFDEIIVNTAYQEIHTKGLLLKTGDARADYSAAIPNDHGTYNAMSTLAIGLS